MVNLTIRHLITLEILTVLSLIAFIACITCTYYDPQLLNRGLWVLLTFAVLCNVYVGSAIEREWRGEFLFCFKRADVSNEAEREVRREWDNGGLLILVGRRT
jgi:hypothetical protein